MDVVYLANTTASPAADSSVALSPRSLFPWTDNAYLEAAVMLPLYLKFLGPTLGYLRGFPSSKKGAARGYLPPQVLVAHILITLTIVVRYYALLLTTGRPAANHIDQALYVSQIATSWILTRNMLSKDPLYKASFQTMTVFIAFAMGTACRTQDPIWQRTAIRCVEWFVFFRWVVYFRLRFKLYQEVPTDVAFHLVSVPVTLCVAGWPNAILAYLVVLPLVMRLNAWVTSHVPDKQAKRSVPLNLLVNAGFCNFATTRPPTDDKAKIK